MKTLILLLLLTGICFDARAQAKLLAQPFSYKPGYSVTLRQTVISETVTKMLGEKEKQKTGNLTEYEYHVTDLLPNGDIKWTTSITRFVLLNMAKKGAKNLYDSSDPMRDTSKTELQIFDKMIGAPMYMTTSDKGQILAFSGADAIFDTMFSSLKDRPDMAAYQDMIKKSYGDSSMLEAMRSMWRYLPKEAIKTGDSWKTQLVLSGLSDMIMEYNYTLKSRNASRAVITSKTESFPGKMTEKEMGGIKIVYDLKGKGSGKIIVSQPDGMLIKGSNTVIMKGIMRMKGQTERLTMDVPLDIKTTVTTERL